MLNSTDITQQCTCSCHGWVAVPEVPGLEILPMLNPPPARLYGVELSKREMELLHGILKLKTQIAKATEAK